MILQLSNMNYVFVCIEIDLEYCKTIIYLEAARALPRIHFATKLVHIAHANDHWLMSEKFELNSL